MSTDLIRLSVVIASTREGRFGPTVATWFVEQVERRDDVLVDVIDLAQARLPTELSASPGRPEAVGGLAERLAAADAFVIVTPEYNHSYPASLKNAIDWFRTEWQAKPVAFVSYGGLAGGLRAVEHLRHVFAELHAVTIRDTVSFHTAWERFDGGGPIDPGPAEAAATTMMERLLWWARALRTARSASPYAA